MTIEHRIGIAIATGRYWHIFKGMEYLSSFYNEATARAYKECGYRTVYIGK